MSNVLDFGLYKFCSFCEKWDGSFLKLLFIPVADKNVYTSMLDTNEMGQQFLSTATLCIYQHDKGSFHSWAV